MVQSDSENSVLEERVSRLTDKQRAFLAARLDAHEELSVSQAKPKQLVAWYVADDEQLTADQLRAVAAARLPRNLVPAHFVRLPSLPRTSTGKLDRRKLPTAPLPVEPHKGNSSSALTAAESQLLHIWKEVLGTQNVTVNDNFLHSGGDSLAIIRVIALCSEVGIHLTPGVFHDHPTITSLAGYLAAKTMKTDAEVAKADKPRSVEHSTEQIDPLRSVVSADGIATPLRLSEYDNRPPLFLIPPKGVAISDLRHVVSATREYTCFAPLTMKRGAADHLSVSELAEQFLAQIREVQATGPYRLAGTCEGAYIAWEIALLLTAAGDDVGFLGIIDTPNPVAMKPKPLLERIRLRIRSLDKSSAWSVLAQIVKRGTSFARRRVQQVVKQEAHLTRAGSRMGWMFQAKPYAGHATLFRAVKQSADTDFTTDATHGWGELPQAGLDISSISCERLQLLEPPYAQVLAKRIELAIQSRESESSQTAISSSGKES